MGNYSRWWWLGDRYETKKRAPPRLLAINIESNESNLPTDTKLVIMMTPWRHEKLGPNTQFTTKLHKPFSKASLSAICNMPVLPNLLRLLSIVLFLSGKSDAKDEDALPIKPSLNMMLCTDKCTGDYQSYITPVSKCYNSGALLLNDPIRSGLDALDVRE
jgi:hypothetical protein